MQRRTFLTTVALGALAGCATSDPKFKRYSGPPVTQLVVNKSARQLLVYSGDKVIAAHHVDLGNVPVGHKLFEGDGKTPEGLYYIDRRNPNSRFHLSLGISYPNPQDVASAQAAGGVAGSDIFIHGRGAEGRAANRADWTAGCIAVTDEEIESLYAMIPDGTPILINP